MDKSYRADSTSLISHASSITARAVLFVAKNLISRVPACCGISSTWRSPRGMKIGIHKTSFCDRTLRPRRRSVDVNRQRDKEECIRPITDDADAAYTLLYIAMRGEHIAASNARIARNERSQDGQCPGGNNAIHIDELPMLCGKQFPRAPLRNCFLSFPSSSSLLPLPPLPSPPVRVRLV